MGSGNSASSAETQQSNIAAQQNATAQEYLQFAQTQFSNATALQQPEINYEQNLVNATNTGNYNNVLSAAGPTVSAISAAGQSAQGNIMNQVAPGAARDYALAQNARQTPTNVASAVNSVYTSAFPTLASLGTQANQLALGQTSAGVSSSNAASTSYGNVATEANQGKAATLGFLGSLASAGGEAASGGGY